MHIPVDPIIFIMCAIFADGSYDCDEKWVVYIYPDIDVFHYCFPNEKTFHFSIDGCGVYDDKRGHFMILSNNGNSRSHTNESIFSHEVRHLQCLCNFHANPPEEPKR